ncbi:hypothetical protein Areg01_83090 [Actinoplanes regularis]|nr:hypothetical protein Areg01_83090 [Actinoplanes regularis]
MGVAVTMVGKSSFAASACRSECGNGSAVPRRTAWPAGRASLVGAGLGGWLGLLIGVVAALVPGASYAVALLSGPPIGAVIGAVMGLLVHCATDARLGITGGGSPSAPTRPTPAQHRWFQGVSPATSASVSATARARLRRARADGLVRLERATLPRLGISYAFDTTGGQRIGVLAHRSGRRHVMSFDPDDVARVLHTTELNETEAYIVANLLGLPVLTDDETVPPHGFDTVRAVRVPAAAGVPD